MLNLYADLVLRSLLGVPGRCLDGWERLAGARDTATGWPEASLVNEIQATARCPEAWLGLERNLEHVRSPVGIVAYRVRGRTAFAVGGLNAKADDRGALVQHYLAAARARGCRRTLLFPVRADALNEVREAGFDSVQVGMEAWLDLDGLTFEGGAYAHVRQMNNRARRRGVEVELTDDPRPIASDLNAVHEAWLNTRRPSWRMALLVGTPCLERPGGRRYVVARHKGVVCGFMTLVPAGDKRVGVDVICRSPEAPPGTVERMMVEVIACLRRDGMARLSLGPCPMAGLQADARKPLLNLVFRLLYGTRLGNRVFGFQSLVKFKNKFRPRWEPISIAATPRVTAFTLYIGCRMWRLL